MKKDLTNSSLDRQNILNNQYALEEIRKEIGFEGVLFEGEYRFLITQVSAFFEVDIRTIKRYIKKYYNELSDNGYEVLRKNRLKDFKLTVKSQFVSDINVPHKTVNLGIFNFRAFLNLTMLLVESEKARVLKSVILDIVIDTINKKTGGGTKYINQRDEDFVVNFLQGEDYRREFTDALKDFVEMGEQVKEMIGKYKGKKVYYTKKHPSRGYYTDFVDKTGSSL